MKSKALLILVLFGGLLAVQSACAAGVSLHCIHNSGPQHTEDSCSQDTCSEDKCRDEFSLPLSSDGLAKIKSLATSIPDTCPLNIVDRPCVVHTQPTFLHSSLALAPGSLPLLS